MLLYSCLLIIFICIIINNTTYDHILRDISIGMIVFSAALYIVIGCIALFKMSDKDTFIVQKTIKAPIISLSTNSSIQGEFFLGCGTFGSEEKYIFMRDLGNQCYLRDNVSTSNTSVQESDESPVFSYDIATRKVDPRWKYICPLWMTDNNQTVQINYKLVVPRHTIIKTFTIK